MDRDSRLKRQAGYGHPIKRLLLMGSLALLVTFPFACGGAPRVVPQAQISADNPAGGAPLTVNFSNTSQNAELFQWDFGDGATATTNSTAEAATHRYTKAGAYTVNMTATHNSQPPETNSITLTVTVRPGPMERVKITPETAKLDIGQSQEFKAEAFDAVDNPIPDATFAWEAAPEAGTLTGGTLKVGTTAGTFAKAVTVTGTLDSRSAKATASVSVSAGTLKTVAITAAEAPAGQPKQLEAIASDQYGNRIDNLEANWTLTDDGAGSLSKTGMLASGEIARTYRDAVSVQVKQADQTQTAKATVTVKPGPLEQVIVAPSPARIGMGMTQQFVAVGADKYGNRISGLEFKWNSDNSGAIDTAGLFTAGTAPGTYKDGVKVEATQAGKTVSAKATVTVEPDRIVFASDRNDKQFDIMPIGLTPMTTRGRIRASLVKG